MKCGIVVFPGSNCDHDVYHVLKHDLGQDVRFLWHDDKKVGGCDLVVLPGGFSYGDYLRAGALATLSPLMSAVRRHAAAGGYVLGICNGFQILLELGLLPGAMMRNRTLRFECRDVYVRVERADTPYTAAYREGQVLKIPIAHAEGNYENTPEALSELEERGQVVFRYVSPEGELDDTWNINGSAGAIAGITNRRGNVLGMMPHPERCSEEILGNIDGRALFEGLIAATVSGLRVPA